MAEKQQLENYKEYVEAKIEIEELPMTFDQFIKTACEHEIIECPGCGWEGNVDDLICLEGIALGDGGFGCPECHRQLQTLEEATKDIVS